MKRFFLLAAVALLLLSVAGPAMAADAAPAGTTATNSGTVGAPDPFLSDAGAKALGVGVGLGLIIIGAGKGIGAIGSHAVDAIARQPEAGGRIFTSMIISAALIEGATLFAIVVALII
jgi:F-type H+-transporting ATPase subunit c